MEHKTALITGAYGGLGSQLANVHAAAGGDLILVDLNRDRLEEMRQQILASYPVRVEVMEADLAKPQEVQDLYDRCRGQNLSVDYLISNAGFGGQGAFAQRDMEKDMNMLFVNAAAPTMLCKLFLPDFLGRGSGRILIVSSVTAKMPGPLQAVYFATKAYLTSLGNALWRETQGTGVTVTTLMPGVLTTEFAEKGHLETTKLFSKGVAPYPVAKKGYDAMLRGRLNVTTGVLGLQKLAVPVLPVLPRRLLLNLVYAMQQDGSATRL